MLYDAWCVIANARDWLLDDAQAIEWQRAAVRWRDEWHATLDRSRCSDSAPGREAAS
jgi:hypothetical protein